MNLFALTIIPFVFLECKYKYIRKYVKKFNDVKSLVSSQNKNIFYIYLLTVKLILETLFIVMLQKLNSTIKKIDNNTFEITYVVNFKLYKILVKPRRGPNPILQVINDDKQDVTVDVLPYLGPNYDWHGNKLDSSFFNSKVLTFEMADGTTQYINFPNDKKSK
jgi:hypothetical protein